MERRRGAAAGGHHGAPDHLVLEEADRLAQQVAVIDHGRLAAEGTPAQLKAAIGGSLLSVRLADTSLAADAAAALADLAAGDQPRVDEADGEIRLPLADAGASVEALRRLDERRVAVAAIELQEPSLDDVFLALTGRTVTA